MGLYQQWPYTNLHELNLDWLIKEMKELTEHIENYVSELGIKYADPFDWDITKQYEQNTIVIDPLTGTAYMSLKPVPSGIDINNTDYWTPIFTLGDLIEGIREGTSLNVEETMYASRAYPEGSLIWVDKTLVRALSNIAAGSAFNTGTGGNCEEISVEIILNEIKADIVTINNNATALESRVTTAEGQIVTDGNAIAQNAGDIVALGNRVSQNENDISNIQTVLANVLPDKYLFIGDSYMVGNHLTGPCFVRKACSWLGLTENTDYYVKATGGYGFVKPYEYSVQKLLSEFANDNPLVVPTITHVFICLGANDWDYNAATLASSCGSVQTIINTIYDSPKVTVVPIGWSKNSQYRIGMMDAYNGYRYYMPQYGMSVVGSAYELMQNSGFYDDETHPNDLGDDHIARYLYNILAFGSAPTSTTKMHPLKLGNGELGRLIIKDGVGVLQIDSQVLPYSPPGASRTGWFDVGNITCAGMLGVVSGTIPRPEATIPVIMENESTARRFYELECDIRKDTQTGAIHLYGRFLKPSETNGSYLYPASGSTIYFQRTQIQMVIPYF